MRTPSFADLSPMLLSEAARPFSDAAWGFELKFDGYRVLASMEATGAVKLKSRNGADATGWFPEIGASLKAVADRRFILDGEMCVLDDLGRSDFDRLHARARKRRADPSQPVVYCVFDVLAVKGESVMGRPLVERKKLLGPIRGLPGILVLDFIPEQGEALYEHVLALGLEGMVAKRLDSLYRPGERSPDWLKVKRPGAVPAKRFNRGGAR